MIGLIFKDLRTAVLQFKLLLILLVMYFGYSIYLKDLAFFASMESVLVLVLSIMAFGYDEKSGWDRIACTFPGGRDRVVVSRYLFGLIISTVMAIAHVIMGIMLRTQASVIADSLLIAFSLSALFMAILFPLLYKFGSEKAKLIFLVLFIGMLAVSSGLLRDNESYVFDFGRVSNVLILVGSLGLLAVSAWISCRIYRRKEF